MASEPTVPEDEELNMDELDEEDMGEDILVSLLTTEEGETITSVLANISASTEAIAKQLEKQNLILVKVLSAMQAAKPCACASPATQ